MFSRSVRIVLGQFMEIRYQVAGRLPERLDKFSSSRLPKSPVQAERGSIINSDAAWPAHRRIAAHTHAPGLIVVTDNISEFSRIPGPGVENRLIADA